MENAAKAGLTGRAGKCVGKALDGGRWGCYYYRINGPGIPKKSFACRSNPWRAGTGGGRKENTAGGRLWI